MSSSSSKSKKAKEKKSKGKKAARRRNELSMSGILSKSKGEIGCSTQSALI
jgi:hypothetical protein